MKVPIYKAHGNDIDREFQGFYFAMPETTYCIDSDYQDNPVKILHFIVFNMMTDWGLPNQPKIATIDPSTLVQVGYVDTEDVNYIPRDWIKGDLK